jgi:hypothetical protein
MTTNWTAKNPKALLKWACFFTLFFGSSAVAQSTVEFRLSCKVMDNIVIEAEEGRPERYTGYADQFAVGDTLDVSVELFSNNRLSFSLLDPLRNNLHGESFFSTDDMTYWDEGGLLYSTSSRRFSIERGDEITFEGGRNEQVTLRRYYRDDWQGTFTAFSGMKVQVAVLDCRVSGQNNLAEITDRLKSIVKKLGE